MMCGLLIGIGIRQQARFTVRRTEEQDSHCHVFMSNASRHDHIRNCVALATLVNEGALARPNVFASAADINKLADKARLTASLTVFDDGIERDAISCFCNADMRATDD
jgi:hypothetical protein